MDDFSPTERQTIAKLLLSEKAADSPDQCATFLSLYRDLTAPRKVNGTTIQIDKLVLSSHARVCEFIHILRLSSSLTRQQFEDGVLSRESYTEQEQQNAIFVLVRLNLMVDCGIRGRYARGYRLGQWLSPRWELDESLCTFVSRVIPRTEEGSYVCPQYRHVLIAWKLKKRCKIQVVGSDNLAEHLLFDSKKRILRVFRHTSWLHTQLERSLQNGDEMDLESGLKIGVLPRPLIQETLETFYEILFPLTTDRKRRSGRLLDKLIATSGFDQNARSQTYSRRLPTDLKYHYWNTRLDELAEFAKKPSPSNRLMAWMQRHSSERNGFWIAIIALVFSIFFGMLSCVIGLAQLWVAILTLKQPGPG